MMIFLYLHVHGMCVQMQILYSYRGDFRACKGLIAAEFSGIQVERKDIEMGHENLTPEFLAQSPLGKVPILETSQGEKSYQEAHFLTVLCPIIILLVL